jgi:hypothetical protein
VKKRRAITLRVIVALRRRRLPRPHLALPLSKPVVFGLLAGLIMLPSVVLFASPGRGGAQTPAAGKAMSDAVANAFSEGSSMRTEATVEVSSASEFDWPASGSITSFFGLYHPTGIDIALDNNVDSPILAARAGAVSFAGGDPCCEYGRFVIIDHGDGFTTLYGHLSKLSVQTGQQVAQGEVLGLGGSTGKSKGKHVHFEMLKDRAYVDPLRYLPTVQPRDRFATWTNACPTTPMPVEAGATTTLRFIDDSLSKYEVDAVAIEAVGGVKDPPAIEAASTGALTVAITSEPVSAALGRGFDYDLAVHLTDGTNQIAVACRLSLKTNRTGRNTPDVADDHPADPILIPSAPAASPTVTATPKPRSTSTATPTPKPPTATPTKTPKPSTSTPAPPTPTPNLPTPVTTP